MIIWESEGALSICFQDERRKISDNHLTRWPWVGMKYLADEKKMVEAAGVEPAS